eukprot:COSAG01_NODE_27668_length_680_cov_0.685026_1_plen_201_part_10
MLLSSMPQLSEEQLRGEAPLQPANLTSLMTIMAALTSRSLGSFSGETHYGMQKMTPIEPMPLRPLHDASPTEVYVHGGMFHFEAGGVEVESAAGSGCDVRFDWEEHPGRMHSKDLMINAMYVDKWPVTNAEYSRYVNQSRYEPDDRQRWLERNFVKGAKFFRPRDGWEHKPVTYVSIEDARAYCAHNNKRLPHAYEWQYFA